ncbi:MAG: hypothetical protein HYW25_04565 [Candidatus Aenigmarchaeota archaeon]|nr:hypothetical protein [Candidatus Aenigmarchaeota archaeon]
MARAIPGLLMVDSFDVTPEVTYGADGRARILQTYCVFNGVCRMASVYEIRDDGTITEWHQDPEHGDWPEPVPMSRERLSDLRRYNSGTVHVDDVLGRSKEEVERVFARKKRPVKHIDSPMPVEEENPIEAALYLTHIGGEWAILSHRPERPKTFYKEYRFPDLRYREAVGLALTLAMSLKGKDPDEVDLPEKLPFDPEQ